MKTIVLYKLKYYNGFLPYEIGFRKSMYVWKHINEDRVQRNLVTIGQKQIVFPCCSLNSLCVVFAFQSDRILKNPIKYTVTLYVLVIFTPKHAIPGAASPITTTTSLDFSFQILEYIKKVLQTTLFACIFAERYTTTTTQHHRAMQRLIIIKGLRATISIISSNVFSLKVRLEVCT